MNLSNTSTQDNRTIELHTASRSRDFEQASRGLASSHRFKSENAILVEGDSLKHLKKIPDHVVSLILTDPPYHSTKKKNITNDTSFALDEDFLAWIEMYSEEWLRVLRPNGCLLVFCSSEMAARIEVMLSQRFNALSSIVWTKPNDPGFDGWKQKMRKESLRQWYAHSERAIFAEPSEPGNLFKSCFANFLKDRRLKCGLSGKELAERIGSYGKINHGGSVSNWEAGRNIPSREQYQKIVEALLKTGKLDEMPPYEDVIRPFEVNSDVEFTDVWNFNSVRPYSGKHPAEKPIEMLQHFISSTTYPGDIVLDCFAGSGNTALAALNLARKSISIELDKVWVEVIKEKLSVYCSPSMDMNSKKAMSVHRPKKVSIPTQSALFV